jgi:hypothetical protein
LSKFSNYIDFTKLGDKENKITRAHEIFDKDEMKYQTHVCAVMQQIMTGQAPVLTDLDIDSLRSNYMKFKFEINKNDPCFKK